MKECSFSNFEFVWSPNNYCMVWYSKGTRGYRASRPYYIMRCLTGVLDFSRVFLALVSKTRVKMQEKCKKNVRKIQNASPMQELFSILHDVFRKNLRLSRILLAFCLRFAHKCDQNANPALSVIWPLHICITQQNMTAISQDICTH